MCYWVSSIVLQNSAPRTTIVPSPAVWTQQKGVFRTVKRFLQSENTNRDVETGWIAMTFDTDIHVPNWMKCSNFGDVVTFHLTSPSEENFSLSNSLVYD